MLAKPQPRPAGTGAMLPPTSPGFLLIAAVFAVTLIVYALFSFQVMVYTEPPTGDQPYYLMTAISISRDGDIEESNNYARQNERLYYPLSFESPFQGIPAPFPLPTHKGQTTGRPPNESYSKHGLGLSVLIVPGWLIGDSKVNGDSIMARLIDLRQLQLPSGGWPAVVYEMNVLGALLAVQVFLLAWEVSSNKLIALAVTAALVFSNPQMTYSYLIFPELPAGLCAIYAFRRLMKGLPANNLFQLGLAGVALGFMPWLHSRYLPITLALFALAIVQWLYLRRAQRAVDEEFANQSDVEQLVLAPPFVAHEDDQPADPAPALLQAPGSRLPAPLRRSYSGSLLLVLGPVVVSGLLLMLYYYWLYHIPLPNTQDHAGFINPLDDPLGIPTSILGLMLDQQWGLLVFAPIYLLSFVGLVAMARNPERRRAFFWLLIIIIPYFLFVAVYKQWWGEWCPPARYLASITPLMVFPLAESLKLLRNNVLYKALFFALSAVGWVMMAGFIAHPRSMFNHPSGQADLFLWVRQQLDVNLTALFPAVVRWAYWHGYGMNWTLLIAWTFICVAIVLFGVLALPTSLKQRFITTPSTLGDSAMPTETPRLP